jgi:replicative DNA helicase
MLAAIIDSKNGAREFIKIDPAPELFKGPELELFEFVRGHIQKHGVPPARETVQAHMPEVSIPTDVPEPPSYYYERMQKRHRHMTLKKVILKAGDLLNSDDPDAAQEAVFDTIVELRKSEYRRRVLDYSQEGAGIIKDHMVAVLKGLDTGIPFGWPSVDYDNNGMQPGDFISFIGRPGKGKTYMLLYLLLHGWRHGSSPMFVSMEMNPKLIVRRMAALDTHTAVTQIKMATVSKAKNKAMMTHLLQNKNMPPAWVIDGGLSATVEDILMHTLEKKPSVVFIDGAYLLRRPGVMSRWERIYDNAEDIKQQICEGLGIPVVCSYQFNRDAAKKQKAKGKKKIDLEDIAGGDAIGQISSLVFGMFDEDTIETMYKRRVELLKGREGERGGFDVNWVFDDYPFMDFSEIVEQTLEDLNFLGDI